MRLKWFSILFTALLLLIAPSAVSYACNNIEATVLQSIVAEPSSVSLDLDVDGTQQLTVTATYSDGDTADVTTEASYESSDTEVATVSDTGLITAVGVPPCSGEGLATITISYNEAGIKATDNVLVTVAVSITFDPWVYDYLYGNGDGEISKSEAITAVMDYFEGVITKQQAIEVIVLYFS